MKPLATSIDFRAPGCVFRRNPVLASASNGLATQATGAVEDPEHLMSAVKSSQASVAVISVK
jgi:hypothetical protein